MNEKITLPSALTNKRFRSTSTSRLSEKGMVGLLAACALLTIGITVAIIFMLVKESWNFFSSEYVTFSGFLFGTEWTALQSGGNIENAKFGILPLLSGTFRVTIIAMLIALPLGLMTAVYLSEFASERVRAVLKPVLEILAGIPTVVLGYFAILVLSPTLQIFSSSFDTFNATSAGIAVGILCLPMVCSLSEDALSAVPRALREGVYGLGGTKLDTSIKVVIPAAMSGIVSAFLLAFSRAIGETMVVALAAGTQANFSANPTQPAQTMTGFIVEMLKSESEYGTVQYFSLFGVAISLFVLTFGMTLLGQYVRYRYQESYQ